MKKSPAERRKHKRFPIIKDLAEPIEIRVAGKEPLALPGVLTNLSAGGLDLVLMGAFDGRHNPHNVQLSLDHIHGFDDLKVSGQIIWTREKGGTTLMGIQFTQIGERHKERINRMAKAYWECENRIEQGDFEICFRECTYWNLCSKTVKLKN
jgi:c-di-GMP-binding flagellar brake protein YcgR